MPTSCADAWAVNIVLMNLRMQYRYKDSYICVQIPLCPFWTTHTIWSVVFPIVDERCAVVSMIGINFHCPRWFLFLKATVHTHFRLILPLVDFT